jgi:transcriptional regulator with XRE-family HTH domain
MVPRFYRASSMGPFFYIHYRPCDFSCALGDMEVWKIQLAKFINKETIMRHQHGGALRALREKAKLTQAQVAKGLGYTSPQFISNMEAGKAAPPLHVLPAMAYIYKVKTDYLKKVVADILIADIDHRVAKVKLTNKVRSKLAKRIQ